MNRFKNVCKINGNDLELNKDSEDEEIIHEIKKNKVDFNETTFINKVIKDNQKKNLYINLREKEEFSSPMNSLLTLKMNKALLNNISQSYVKTFISKNASKISEIPSLLNSDRKVKKNIKFHKIKFNNKNKFSKSKTFSDNISIIKKEKTVNPLITLYNNTYYPRSYKNKNYIKEMKSCLPPLTLNNDYLSEIIKYNQIINKYLSYKITCSGK